MWQCIQPIQRFLEGFNSPVIREVAGVEEQVAGGDVGGLVGVRVADTDDADGRPVFGRVEGGPAQADEEGV